MKKISLAVLAICLVLCSSKSSYPSAGAFIGSSGGGGGAVSSVFGRTGSVTAQSSDYSSFYESLLTFTAPLVNSSGTVSCNAASSSQAGCLSSTDWSTFNSKQATGSYLTALTGDVAASGPGSANSTIQTGAVTESKTALSNKPSATVVSVANQTLSGLPTIDGVATAAGSIILLTAQTTASQNGPWVAASGSWTRPTWYPSGGTVQSFQFITELVRLGTVYQGSTWRQTAAAPITIDTTSTTWAVTLLALNTSTTTGLSTSNTASTAVLRDTNGNYNSEGLPSGQIKSVTTSPYTVASTDYLLLVSTSSIPITINLPSPATVRTLEIKDVGGNFGTNNVTLARFASENIEGLGQSLILSANSGHYKFQSDGTNWWKVSTANNVAIKIFTSSGTFTPPAGVSVVSPTGRGGSGGGAGGASGGGGSTTAGAGGGGSGATGHAEWSVPAPPIMVTPGTAYAMTIGAGGTAGAGGTPNAANAAGSSGMAGTSGGAGGNTTFDTLFTWKGAPVGAGAGQAGTATAGGTAGTTTASGFYGLAGNNGGNGGAPGVVGNPGGVTAFTTPYGVSSAVGAGGASGGVGGGGGGAGAGVVLSGDSNAQSSSNGGVGGTSGNNGGAAPAANAATNGSPGSGGGGGGGGGLLAVTGSQGGAGAAGTAGSNGQLIITWQE